MGIPAIGTRRLVLRPWAERDVPALHRLWTDPAISCKIWNGEAIPIERATETVREAVQTADSDGVGCWTVAIASAPDSVFGCCGLMYFEVPRRIELVIALLPEYWGCGFGTEASHAVLEFAFQRGFECVYARAAAGNCRCVRMLERLGMQLDARTWIEETPDFCFSLSSRELIPVR